MKKVILAAALVITLASWETVRLKQQQQTQQQYH